jgi:hypothetical protein
MKTSITAVFLLVIINTYSQDSSRMETDRPDQTESPFITKLRYIQAELGFNFEKNDGLTTLVHPTILWKYGLIKKFEIRVITEIASQETPVLIPQGNDVQTGLLPVKIGGKLSLWEEKGLLPKTSVIGHVAFHKLASKYYQASKLAPEFRVAMQHTLSDKIGLGYNLGAEWDGETNSPYYIYTIGPGFNLGKSGYLYVELFGEFNKDTQPEHNFDAGFALYLSDNAKVDISSGFNLANSSQYYIALGFSFRFKAL